MYGRLPEQFIEVDALPVSGKGNLLALLDGHPTIGCFPIGACDQTLSSISKFFFELGFRFSPGKVKRITADTVVLTELIFWLHTLKYYIHLHRTRTVGVYGNTEELLKASATLPVDFDYFKMQEALFNHLVAVKPLDITPQRITAIVAHACRTSVTGMVHDDSSLKYYVFNTVCSTLNTFKCDLFPRFFPGSKRLYISRHYADSLPIDFLGHSEVAGLRGGGGKVCADELLCDYIEAWIASGNRDVIWANHMLAPYLAETEPDSFKIVDFSRMLNDTEEVMRDVAEWLDIPFDPILCKYTFMGQEFCADSGSVLNGESEETRLVQRLRRTTRLDDIVNERLQRSVIPLVRIMFYERHIIQTFLDKATRERETHPRVAVYGAGNLGPVFMKALFSNDIEVEYILDSQKREYSLVIPQTCCLVLRPYNASIKAEDKENMPVYVATTLADQYQQIRRDLHAFGWKNVVLRGKN